VSNKLSEAIDAACFRFGVLVIVAGVLSAAAAAGTADRVVGQWSGGGLTISFAADGTGLFGSRACLWSVQGDFLQLKDRQNPANTTRYAVRWEGETLLLQHADGSRYELRRASAAGSGPPGRVFPVCRRRRPDSGSLRRPGPQSHHPGRAVL